MRPDEVLRGASEGVREAGADGCAEGVSLALGSAADVDRGDYRIAELKCALCGSDLASAEVVSERARGVPSRRVLCIACGLVQVSPQPSEIIAPLDEPIRLRGRDIPIATVEHAEMIAALEEARRARASALLGEAVEQVCKQPDPLPHVPPRVPAAAAVYDLQCWRDPVASLRRLRDLGMERVVIEVPDVDAYTGDRDGRHYRADHLFDFSATTLVSALLRAGFGGVHVVAHDGALTAWGVAGADAILCDDVGTRLAQLRSIPLECVPDAATPLLDRWLAGESLSDCGADEAALRSELAALQSVYATMIQTWDDAVRSLRTTQDAWSRESRSQIERLNTDAWLNGADFGRGVAYDQAAKAVSHIVHRMGRLSGAFR